MELFVSCYFNAFVYEITGFRIYIILLVDFFLDKQDDICSCFNVLLVEVLVDRIDRSCLMYDIEFILPLAKTVPAV